MPLSIRIAGPSDADVLSAIAITVWIDTYVPRGVSAEFAAHVCDEYTPKRFVEHINAPQGKIIIAELGGLVVGFLRLNNASLCPTDNELTAEIATLYVLPRQHGNGVGTALLDAATHFLVDMQICCAWLIANAQNTQALEFYCRRGWQQIGTYDFVINQGRYMNLVFKSPRIASEGIAK